MPCLATSRRFLELTIALHLITALTVTNGTTKVLPGQEAHTSEFACSICMHLVNIPRDQHNLRATPYRHVTHATGHATPRHATPRRGTAQHNSPPNHPPFNFRTATKIIVVTNTCRLSTRCTPNVSMSSAVLAWKSGSSARSPARAARPTCPHRARAPICAWGVLWRTVSCSACVFAALSTRR